jgi:hypothetical protein
MTTDSAPTQQNTLLEEGGRSYPKAMLALSQFREMVQDACIDAMRRSLRELSGALRLQMKAQQVKAWASPDELDSDEIDDTWANLGAELKEPGGAAWSLWNYIWWGDDPSPLNVTVSIFFADAGNAERVWAAARDHGTWKYDEDAKEIHLSRGIKAADLASLGSTLDEMNSEWIRGWQKVGGVKQFLRKR